MPYLVIQYKEETNKATTLSPEFVCPHDLVEWLRQNPCPDDENVWIDLDIETIIYDYYQDNWSIPGFLDRFDSLGG